MKKISLVCALFLSASFAFGEGTTAAYSTNTFAMVKLSSLATNTLIAVPWVGYTEDALPSREEFIDHLVKPDNLTLWEESGAEGDMLLVVGTNKHYKSWHLKELGGIRQWVQAKDILISTNYTKKYEKDITTNCIARGYGLWLIRRDPSRGPFYLEGQYTTGPTSVVVCASVGATNSVMVAHPVCTRQEALNINGGVGWSGVNPGDTLSVPCANSKWDYCKWDAVKTKWYRTKSVTESKTIGNKTITVVKQENDYDITIPVGLGFWYNNRGPDNVTITFE